jgi:hypothetical protein
MDPVGNVLEIDHASVDLEERQNKLCPVFSVALAQWAPSGDSPLQSSVFRSKIPRGGAQFQLGYDSLPFRRQR